MRLDRDVRVFRWKKMERDDTKEVTRDTVLLSLKENAALAQQAELQFDGMGSSYNVLFNGRKKHSYKIEQDFSAMGEGTYIAFNPVESMFFGYIDGSSKTSFESYDTDQVGALISFVIPKGTVYAIIDHPLALKRARDLYATGNCSGYPWRSTVTLDASAFKGIAGVQAIFRSCPRIKNDLLSYSEGGSKRLPAFVVYSEYSHTYVSNQWSIDGFVPNSAINDELSVQAKHRWGLLIDVPAEKEVEIRNSIEIWFPPKRDGFNDVSKNKKLLHCAVIAGTGNFVARTQGSLWWKPGIAQFPFYFLGYSPDNLGKDYDAALANFSSAMDSQSILVGVPSTAEDLWEIEDYGQKPKPPLLREFRMQLNLPEQCPSIYALAYSLDPLDVAFVKGLVGERAVGAVSNCPYYPKTLGFGIDTSIPAFVNIKQDFPRYGTDTDFKKSCQDYLSGYRDIADAFKTWEGKIPECSHFQAAVAKLVIPPLDAKRTIDKCDDESRSELDDWLFSSKHVDDDLTPGVLGDEWPYVLNQLDLSQ
jgi:hypothetical protein